MVGVPLAAQDRLTLADAVTRARARQADVRAATTAAAEAALEPAKARAAFLPRVDASESWQRGNHPVFVFSSLLSQRRFTETNFAIDALNHPDAVNNVRSAVGVEQVLFDGALLPGLQAARLGADAAEATRARVERDIAVAATEAYGRALLFDALAGAADAASKAAEQDLARTRDRRDAGLATDADVLTIDVHLAQTRERTITARAEAGIARARLNDLMGEPLERTYALEPGVDASAPAESIDILQAQAVASRPEVRLAAINRAIADTAVSAARAAWLPQVAMRGAWEANGGSLSDQVSSWALGAEVRVNLFRGMADRARLAQARLTAQRRDTEREQAEASVRLDVLSARARLEAAQQRGRLAQALVAQARERQRITRDRYETGLDQVTALLQAGQAVLEAEAQTIGARVDALVQRAALDRAAGR